MSAHPIRSMLITSTEYPISVRNDGIHVVLIENNSFYNKVIIEHVKALEGNHYNSLKVIHVSFGVREHVEVNPNAKILVNVLSRTPFHNIVTTKFVPPNLGGDPP
jgi:hypothetical protein